MLGLVLTQALLPPDPTSAAHSSLVMAAAIDPQYHVTDYAVTTKNNSKICGMGL
jgi:hypothetical protein